jgi:hypothetical protein
MTESESNDLGAAPTLSQGARDALAELIETHERRRAPDVLTIAPILSELAMHLDGVASGQERLFENDRKSLACDADIALTRVGTRLERSTTPTLRNLRTKDISRLQQLYSDPGGAAALATTLRGILDQLRAPSVVGAAWDDMLAAMADGAATTADCALRVAQVAELARARGHDWSSIKTNLTSAVVHDDLPTGREAAMSDPPTDVVVVWVAFGNAHLRDAYRRVGQVQFFGDQLKLQHPLRSSSAGQAGV